MLNAIGPPSVCTADCGLRTTDRAISTHAITPSVISRPYLSGICIFVMVSGPCRLQSSLRIMPVRRPNERHQLHLNVYLLRFQTHCAELFRLRIKRTTEIGSLRFELRFQIRELLVDRRDILLRPTHVFRFFHRTAYAASSSSSPAKRAGAGLLSPEKRSQQSGAK